MRKSDYVLFSNILDSECKTNIVRGDPADLNTHQRGNNNVTGIIDGLVVHIVNSEYEPYEGSSDLLKIYNGSARVNSLNRLDRQFVFNLNLQQGYLIYDFSRSENNILINWNETINKFEILKNKNKDEFEGDYYFGIFVEGGNEINETVMFGFMSVGKYEMAQEHRKNNQFINYDRLHDFVRLCKLKIEIVGGIKTISKIYGYTPGTGYYTPSENDPDKNYIVFRDYIRNQIIRPGFDFESHYHDIKLNNKSNCFYFLKDSNNIGFYDNEMLSNHMKYIPDIDSFGGEIDIGQQVIPSAGWRFFETNYINVFVGEKMNRWLLIEVGSSNDFDTGGGGWDAIILHITLGDEVVDEDRKLMLEYYFSYFNNYDKNTLVDLPNGFVPVPPPRNEPWVHAYQFSFNSFFYYAIALRHHSMNKSLLFRLIYDNEFINNNTNSKIKINRFGYSEKKACKLPNYKIKFQY